MANTFGTLNGTLIAQRALTTLVNKLPLLSRISTKFTDQQLFDQAVKVKLAGVVAAVDYHADNGYVASDSTDSEVTVTMDQHKHVTRHVSVEEAHSTNENLLDKYAALDAHSLATPLIDLLLGLVKDTAVPTATQQTVKAVGSFDRATLIDMGTAMDNRKVADVGRFAILNPAYYGALKKDTTVVSNNVNPASSTITSGFLPDVDGFDVIKYNGVPANSENLVGLTGVAESFAIATGIPTLDMLEGVPVAARSTVVTEPQTGLSVLLVEYVDVQKGKAYRSYRWMFGGSLGNATTIEKLASA
ncbi:MAG: hypothetical protein ACPG32_04365 [Akkermansiaceae bacterium]